jgi:hypothetical protein
VLGLQVCAINTQLQVLILKNTPTRVTLKSPNCLLSLPKEKKWSREIPEKKVRPFLLQVFPRPKGPPRPGRGVRALFAQVTARKRINVY